MKKSTTIFLILLVFIITIPFAVIGYIEMSTEKTLSQTLETQHITAKKIEFSFISNTLEISNLYGTDPTNPLITFGAEKIKIKAPNLDAFNPEISGHPTVAEEIVIQNILISYPMTQGQDKVSIAQMRVLGWRQNLGKFFAVLHKKNSEEYFTALLDSYIASIELSGIQSSNTLIATQKSKTQQIILKNISPKNIGLYEIHGLSSDSEQPGVGVFYNDIKKVQIEDFAIPSAKFLASLWKIVANKEMTVANKQTQIFTALAKEVHAENNYSLSLTQPDIGIMRNNKKMRMFFADHFQAAAAYEVDKGFSFALKLNGLQVDTSLYEGTQIHAITQAMLGSAVIQGDVSTEGIFHTSDKESSFVLQLNGGTLGVLQGRWHMLLPWANFQSFYSALSQNADLFSILQASQTKDLQFTYEDKGLLPRTLLAIAKLNDMPLGQAFPLFENYVDMQSLQLKKYLTEENFNNALNCIKNHGKLQSALTFEKAIPNIAIGIMTLANPQSLPLKVICTPGENILEATQKLLP